MFSFLSVQGELVLYFDASNIEIHITGSFHFSLLCATTKRSIAQISSNNIESLCESLSNKSWLFLNNLEPVDDAFNAFYKLINYKNEPLFRI